jgi:hypothetical protein
MAGLGALAASRMRVQKTIKTIRLPMGQTTVYKGAGAVLSGGYVIEAATATDLNTIGVFTEQVTNTGASGAKTAEVEFPYEMNCEYFGNGTSGDAIAITDIGKLCYWIDDQTVSIDDASDTRSPAGFIVGVDTTLGVLVSIQPTWQVALATPTITSFANATHGHTNAAGGGVLAAPAITSFAAATHTHVNAAGGGTIKYADGGTLALTGVTCTISTPGTNTHYRAPASATQASVVVLGNTSSVMGDFVRITSAGAITYTITYYDGTYARTAALSASKTHLVNASYDGAAWIFDYTVGAT